MKCRAVELCGVLASSQNELFKHLYSFSICIDPPCMWVIVGDSLSGYSHIFIHWYFKCSPHAAPLTFERALFSSRSITWSITRTEESLDGCHLLITFDSFIWYKLKKYSIQSISSIQINIWMYTIAILDKNNFLIIGL